MRLTQPITLDEGVLATTVPDKPQPLNFTPSLHGELSRSTGDTPRPLYIAPLATYLGSRIKGHDKEGNWLILSIISDMW